MPFLLERASQRLMTGSPASLVIVAAIVSMFMALLPPHVRAQQSSEKTGRQLYEAACATCHGADGAGAAASAVGFAIPLPDFTDCQFATREPDDDWIGVTHDGGPVRGFDRMMPAFGEALNLDEIERIMGHVRGFCGDDSWPRGELNLPRPLVTEKAYPEDEAVLTLTANAEGSKAVTQTLLYEKRFGARNQIEVSVPFGFVQQDAGTWRGGVGDIALGLKRALFHSLKQGSIFSTGGEFVLPTGDQENGLGSGTTLFEPFVAFGQILPSESFLHFQTGMEIPVRRGRSNEAFWRAAAGKSFVQDRFGRTWSPMVEVLGSRVLAASEKTLWDVVPQFQVTLNTRQHVMLNVGVRIPVNESGARSTRVMVYLLWDWFDGGFLEGW